MKNSLSRNKIPPLSPFPKELELCNTILDRIGDEVMVINKDGKIVHINNAAAKGLGYLKEKIIGKSVVKFLKNKISEKKWKETAFIEIKKKKKPVSYIVERIVKGKNIRSIDVTATYMKYATEEYILSVARDITERLEIQEKLKESEELHSTLSEQARDGIVTFDSEGSIVYANKASEGFTKVSLSKSKGSNFIKFVAKDSLLKSLGFFRKVKRGIPVIAEEINLVDKDGVSVPVEFTASPILKKGKVVNVHVIIRDISRRKHLEELVRESEKMKALRDVIAGTTYEVQHPLKGVFDQCQKLIKKYGKRDFEYVGFKEFRDIIDTLKVVRDQSKKCFEVTEKLLSLNKRKVGLKEGCCNVNEIIEETVNISKHHIEEAGVKLKLNLTKKIPMAVIGQVEFNQIIVNVLTNAVQAMPAGGKAIIKTSYQKNKNAILVECSDQGVGIPKEELSRIFDPFFTTKYGSAEKTSGLGLSIVHSIIKAYNGEIFVSSTLRKGTVVQMFLPRCKTKCKK
ncbi:MAG: PAS domain S-box protein [Candidatus Zapsychrus exili]|nr:PAS domain S-box protein [Candidatus Zapsychrus exili]